MITCSNCGAPLREGAGFCSTCGAPVKAAAPKAAPAPAEEVSMKDTYPNVLGFYGDKGRAVSVSDRAAVFGDDSGLYRVDKNLHMRSSQYKVNRVVQTKTGIRALSEECGDSGRTLELLELDDDLKLLSRRQVATPPDSDMPEKCGYTMSEHYLFTARRWPV